MCAASLTELRAADNLSHQFMAEEKSLTQRRAGGRLNSRCPSAIYLTCTSTPEPLLFGFRSEELKPPAPLQWHRTARKRGTFLNHNMIYGCWSFRGDIKSGLKLRMPQQRPSEASRGPTITSQRPSVSCSVDAAVGQTWSALLIFTGLLSLPALLVCSLLEAASVPLHAKCDSGLRCLR